MNKKLLFNYIINIILLISGIMVAVTGIIKFPGFITKIGLSYKDLPMGTISAVHDWSGLVMVISLIFHIIFHWNWLPAVTKTLFRKK